jgi:hypothetical protein
MAVEATERATPGARQGGWGARCQRVQGSGCRRVSEAGGSGGAIFGAGEVVGMDKSGHPDETLIAGVMGLAAPALACPRPIPVSVGGLTLADGEVGVRSSGIVKSPEDVSVAAEVVSGVGDEAQEVRVCFGPPQVLHYGVTAVVSDEGCVLLGSILLLQM